MVVEHTNENGDVLVTAIEQLSSASRLTKGTYKVTKSLKGKWSISYNVGGNAKEQFTSATNLSATTLTGGFTSTNLTHTASAATCTFKYKVNTVTASGSVKATISKGKLVVN